jgi:hypothetical protein
MMKHLVIESPGLARPGLVRKALSLRGKISSYATATLTALTLLLGAGAAQAAHITVTRTPHPRRGAAIQEPQPTSAHSRTKAFAPHASAHATRKSLARPVGKAVGEKQAASATKPHARDRHHRVEEQEQSIEMNRVSLRRAPRRNGRSEAPLQFAEHRAPEHRLPKRRNLESSATPAVLASAADDHQLTSADFLHAAAAGNTDAPAKRPVAIAHVESNDPYAVRPAIPEDPAPTSDELTYLAHPSHEELSEEVAVPMVLPGLYRNGRLIVPAPLKGTHEILVHQNLMADDEGLERIQDDDDLARLRATHQLINFPESASLHVNPELSSDRRCARPWTVHFAADIARQYYAHFHQPLQVNSAVRTIAYQLRLQRVNGNAAGIGGDVASPHLTGQAIDFGKSGMSIAEIAWMRAYLKPLMDTGKLDVEEEFQQACFHISVYRNYLPAVPKRPKTELATLHTPKTAPAASRIDRDE